MEQIEDFTLNYWGKEFDYTNPPKKNRKIKRNLTIISFFVALIMATPALVLNINKSELLSKKEAATSTKISSPSTQDKIASIENPTQGIVIKNDSYWKISKRYCETGEFYLSIQERNNFKPLFEGDSVTVTCR